MADPPPRTADDGAPTAELLVDGRAVLRYTLNHQERPTAEGALARAGFGDVVPAVLDQLAGWWLTSPDEALVDALLAAGATLARHVHLYSRSLTPADAAEVALPAGVRWTPVDRPVTELARLVVQAYPPGHVDHVSVDPALEESELAALLSGGLVGPFLDAASGLLIDDRPHGGGGAGPVPGRIAAAVIVNRSPGRPPAGGPWVSQVFRHPDPAHAGAGALALRRCVAILAAAGEASLGLAVTDGNPAEHLYRRLGFEHISTRRKLAIPG